MDVSKCFGSIYFKPTVWIYCSRNAKNCSLFSHYTKTIYFFNQCSVPQIVDQLAYSMDGCFFHIIMWVSGENILISYTKLNVMINIVENWIRRFTFLSKLFKRNSNWQVQIRENFQGNPKKLLKEVKRNSQSRRTGHQTCTTSSNLPPSDPVGGPAVKPYQWAEHVLVLTRSHVNLAPLLACGDALRSLTLTSLSCACLAPRLTKIQFYSYLINSLIVFSRGMLPNVF